MLCKHVKTVNTQCKNYGVKDGLCHIHLRQYASNKTYVKLMVNILKFVIFITYVGLDMMFNILPLVTVLQNVDTVTIKDIEHFYFHIFCTCLAGVIYVSTL